ncbi:hypothetical protein A584_01801 [Pseudomonas syringae pv. theae ICMP 3923]|uniref:hypothetical protein n=1 Tax=Pseudomonas syringae TaxID=317 RepID=UPI0002EA5379|nr:hypothetical protein [Pseudomonas syringae]EPM73244.1 hypothetical protein A584_01801 [Pseudomonas syringae pv. theae ICMP 3923]KPZ34779.1 hypothetical protein AN901_200688 [Pseudomonas syringae pv. theae]MBL3872223.1 hypothetical protein [Pseudomonas syringae pv. theae]GKQ32690.1 hypothetical protein PSTH68_24245 [Pseudomonas syringae pv. theae]GKS06584.1 hypothetical protein PSTH1771_16230 [Pseudomonas syringae pv. theae]
MISHTHINPELVEDLREILILLALASAVIASPTTPPLVTKVIAVMVQHTAMTWADLLITGISVVDGGDQ